jgi:hypothetical protein
MNVTDEMLQAAMRKAIEAGLLPRRACPQELEINQQLLLLVVQAALNALSAETSHALPKDP